MILYPANLNGGHFVLARNAANVGPHSRFDLGPDESGAILGAEDDVIE
jgi:hypothetical protein